jgi:hypothetical protein
MDDFGVDSMDVPEIPEPIEVPDLPEAPDVQEIAEPSEIPDISDDTDNSPAQDNLDDSQRPDAGTDLRQPAIGDAPSSPDRGSEQPPRDEVPQDPRIDSEPSGDRRPEDWTNQPAADAPPQDSDPGSRSSQETQLDGGADQSSLDADQDAKQLEAKPEILHPEDEVRPEGMEPNSTYERNGYEYKTDEMGRTREVSGDLKLEEGERTKLQTEVGHMGAEDDEGGHLIGTRFDGPTDAFNLVPQNANLNRGEWKAMENSWASDLEQGKDVKVMVTPIFTGDSIRPDSFDVLTQVDGELTYTSFQNQASDKSTKEK